MMRGWMVVWVLVLTWLLGLRVAEADTGWGEAEDDYIDIEDTRTTLATTKKERKLSEFEEEELEKREEERERREELVENAKVIPPRTWKDKLRRKIRRRYTRANQKFITLKLKHVHETHRLVTGTMLYLVCPGYTDTRQEVRYLKDGFPLKQFDPDVLFEDDRVSMDKWRQLEFDPVVAGDGGYYSCHITEYRGDNLEETTRLQGGVTIEVVSLYQGLEWGVIYVSIFSGCILGLILFWVLLKCIYRRTEGKKEEEEEEGTDLTSLLVQHDQEETRLEKRRQDFINSNH